MNGMLKGRAPLKAAAGRTVRTLMYFFRCAGRRAGPLRTICGSCDRRRGRWRYALVAPSGQSMLIDSSVGTGRRARLEARAAAMQAAGLRDRLSVYDPL
jgi:hypothetical protein